MADLKGKKILVVDDNKMIRRQLSALLSKYGGQVLQASNGREGFNVAVVEMPDIILMDVQMPEMDGYVATTKIKAEENTKDIPIIMLTGNKEKEDLERGKSCGVSFYLTKPVPGATIVEIILKSLDIK